MEYERDPKTWPIDAGPGDCAGSCGPLHIVRRFGFDHADCTSSLILVRHAEVAQRYRGICYGQSDVELSEKGKTQSESLARDLADLNPTKVFHSGLTRTRILAESLTRHTGAPVEACYAIRERHFGDWELLAWDEIHEQHRGDLDRLLSEPNDFRPGGGETTFELRDRIVAWYLALIEGEFSRGASLALSENPARCCVAITHGGPIAALLGHLEGLPAQQWASRIPAMGQGVCIDLTSESRVPSF